MIKTAIPKDDQCPICYNERGGFSYRKVEGICEACVLRMMYAFDLTVRGGSFIRQDGRCFCCHRQKDPDDLQGGACHFCTGAGHVFTSAHMKNEKVNKQRIPPCPPMLILEKAEAEKWISDPLEYLDMFWDVPAGTEWVEDGSA